MILLTDNKMNSLHEGERLDTEEIELEEIAKKGELLRCVHCHEIQMVGNPLLSFKCYSCSKTTVPNY